MVCGDPCMAFLGTLLNWIRVVHARGGTVFVLQEPEYTTAETKATPYSLVVFLDANNAAQGSVYIDDGVSLHPDATKLVTVSIASRYCRDILLMVTV